MGSCNGGSHGFLGVALAPYLQVGVFPAATCATQDFGIAHDSGVIACDHPVVAGGTTVSTAVSGGGRIHREGGTQVLHSGDLFLMGSWFGILGIVPRHQRLRRCAGSQLVTGRDVTLHMEHLTR